MPLCDPLGEVINSSVELYDARRFRLIGDADLWRCLCDLFTSLSETGGDGVVMMILAVFGRYVVKNLFDS